MVAIEKDSRNQHGNYDYVSAEAMIAKTRAAMLELGLVLYRESAEIVHIGGVPVLRQDYLLIDTETDQSVGFRQDLPCPERKGTPADKAALASMTTGLNYAIRDLLMVSRGREDQVDAFNDKDFDPHAKNNAKLDAAVASAKEIFAPAEKVIDTREVVSAEDLGRLRKILESGVAGNGAEQRWLTSAAAYVKSSTGVERTYTSLEEIPAVCAAKIIERYKPDYIEWAKRKEAA